MTRTVRALSMFSGGLDSLLATRVIKDLGVEVVALHFTAPFIRPISRGASERGVEYWRRVLGVTANGASLDQARALVYAGIGRIAWPGMHFRKDIGLRGTP